MSLNNVNYQKLIEDESPSGILALRDLNYFGFQSFASECIRT